MIVGLIVGMVLIGYVSCETWLVMLLLGSIHSEIEGVPAAGFWTTFLVLCLLHFVGSIFATSVVKKS
jgi:hypothetical protein